MALFGYAEPAHFIIIYIALGLIYDTYEYNSVVKNLVNLTDRTY